MIKLENRGFSLLRINYFYATFVCILCVLSAISSYQLYVNVSNNAKIHEQYENAAETSLRLQQGSDNLTNEARLFVTTQELVHFQNYFDESYINKNREKALSELSKTRASAQTMEEFEKSINFSYELMNQEIYAMKLVFEVNNFNPSSISSEAKDRYNRMLIKPEDEQLSKEEKLQLARNMMFSQEYINYKSEIVGGTRTATEKLLKEIVSMREQNLKYIRIFTILTVFLVLLAFLSAILFLLFNNRYVTTPIKNFINKINRDEKLSETGSNEFKFLAKTYNSIYDKHKADEILLRQKAEHDELTGLLNRSAFAQLTGALANNKQNLVMLFIDVDLFKHINDQYGHAAGDKVLKQVAHILSENFRSIDFVSRIGGDEFAVIATDTDIRSKSIIGRKLESIQEKLSVPLDEDMPSVTLSIGVAFSTNGYSQELYNKADKALYRVKQNGRNNYFIDPEVIA